MGIIDEAASLRKVSVLLRSCIPTSGTTGSRSCIIPFLLTVLAIFDFSVFLPLGIRVAVGPRMFGFFAIIRDDFPLSLVFALLAFLSVFGFVPLSSLRSFGGLIFSFHLPLAALAAALLSSFVVDLL